MYTPNGLVQLYLTIVQFATNQMRQRLGGNKELAEKLIPKTFSIGCRRPTVGFEIYPAQRY